ncbi:membrane protein, putative [Microscilla marina ATCC 23134]|uniref:Membrane protein, putative n=1 Tax=Microscilla marina ATCC 23134 TaxID=313606 RepID=A1ZCX7_MICM2|nr:membrane protein, putative [Microscilla marina ATCC 23134]
MLTYNQTFDSKVAQAGDNAGYYILGKSLALGQGFTNIHTKDKTKHRHFPPGYPAIIALAHYFSFGDMLSIKQLSGFLLLGSIVLAFLIFYQLSDNYHLSFILSLFMVTNYHLLTFGMMMMSEIPFLFFSLLSFLVLLKIDFNQPFHKNWRFAILIMLLGVSYYIRSIGLSLFAGSLLWILLQKKWKYSVALLVGFLLLVSPWQWRQHSLGGGSYIKQLFFKNPYNAELGSMTITDWFARFWVNLIRYISREIPSGLLNITNIDYKVPSSHTELLLGLAILALIIVGTYAMFKKHPVIPFYILGTAGILLLWPSVWFGVRFLLPLIPLLFFMMVNGMITLYNLVAQKYWHTRITTPIAILLVVVGLFSMKIYASDPLHKLKQASQNPYPPNYNNYLALAKWVKKNTPDSVLVTCRKEQLFYVFADRTVTRFKSTTNEEEQLAFLKAKGVDYVVLDQLGFSDTRRYLLPTINKYPRKFKLVVQAKKPDTYLFKFLPELGYSGSWKGKKRHGKGVFVWGDGEKFIGTWKNNLRNGPGILYLKNGEQMEGSWVNDTLQGTVIHKTKEGTLLEKSLYKDDKKVQVLDK